MLRGQESPEKVFIMPPCAVLVSRDGKYDECMIPLKLEAARRHGFCRDGRQEDIEEIVKKYCAVNFYNFHVA
jgi:hypothetical protein